MPHPSQIIDRAGNGVKDPSKVFVFVDGHVRDLGVVVLGTAGADTLTIRPTQNHQLEIDASGGTKLATNQSCNVISDTVLRCDIPHTLHVAAYGNDGDDKITFQGDFPRDFTSHVNGGRGNNVLTGGESKFFTGIEGEDWLYGNGGDDALLSERRPGFNHDKLTQNVPYTDGADHLFGGEERSARRGLPLRRPRIFRRTRHRHRGLRAQRRPPDIAQLAQPGDNPR